MTRETQKLALSFDVGSENLNEIHISFKCIVLPDLFSEINKLFGLMLKRVLTSAYFHILIYS